MNRREWMMAAGATFLGGLPFGARAQSHGEPITVRGSSADVAGERVGRAIRYPVEVNGRPLRFMLDTGLPGAGAISRAGAAAVGLEVSGTTAMSDPSGRGAGQAQLFSARTLSVGALTYTDLHFFELPPMGAITDQVDGILGLDLFRELTFTLDFIRPALVVRPEPLPAAGALGFTRDPFIRVEARVGDKTIPAHLDSGNMAGAFIAPEGFARSLPLKGEPRSVGRARTVSNTFDIMAAELAAPLSMGPFELAATEVRWPGVFPDLANIGAASFEGRRLTIDLRNSRLIVEAASAG
jgi:hypothetical protein